MVNLDNFDEKLDEPAMMFLGDILKNHVDLMGNLDSKASALLAISGAIFVFASSFFPNSSIFGKIGLGVIILASAFAYVLSVLTIKFPKKDLPHVKNLMYYKGFEGLSIEEYSKKLCAVIGNKKLTVEEYAKEIYDVVNQGLKIKYKLLKVASFILCVGFLLSCVMVILNLTM